METEREAAEKKINVKGKIKGKWMDDGGKKMAKRKSFSVSIWNVLRFYLSFIAANFCRFIPQVVVDITAVVVAVAVAGFFATMRAFRSIDVISEPLSFWPHSRDEKWTKTGEAARRRHS